MNRPDTILIVEDHTMIAEYLASVLAVAGFEPIQAHTLAAARRLLAQRPFALWLCDLRLPDGSGTALLAERDHPRHAGTPAIALSADLDAQGRRELLRHGFNLVLAKPCAPDTLVAAVYEALDRPRTDRPQHPTGTALVGSREPIAQAAVLDDSAALRVCGDAATVAAMRRLLARELERIGPYLLELKETGQRGAILSELHKFGASTAWCGAAEAGAAAQTLGSILAAESASGADEHWADFDAALGRLARHLNACL